MSDTPEASHDLIEAQESVLLLRDLPQALKETWLGLNVAAVAHNWLQNDASNLALVLLELFPHVIKVIVPRCQGGLYIQPQARHTPHSAEGNSAVWEAEQAGAKDASHTAGGKKSKNLD